MEGNITAETFGDTFPNILGGGISCARELWRETSPRKHSVMAILCRASLLDQSSR